MTIQTETKYYLSSIGKIFDRKVDDLSDYAGYIKLVLKEELQIKDD